ncbi:MAG: LamG domain-containing protein [Saprospiraceae bacterium]|nr:LamG domain-containing protein [Saprospiraceae bacterium]
MITIENKCSVDTIPGKAILATGSDKHGYVPDFNLEDVDSLTVTAWIKPSGIQPDYSAIFMGDGTNAAGFNLREGNNTLGYHWPAGAWYWDSNIIVPSDQWSFVAMVVKPTGVTLYCNEQQATHNFTLTPTDIPAFRIGSYRNWGVEI